MGDYRTLRVWDSARELTKAVYRVTEGFPGAERFGLSSQLRNASASIGANLAEGLGRSSQRDAARFIDIAIGSTNEVEHLVATAHDVGYLTSSVADGLTTVTSGIRQMLTGLQRTIRKRLD